MSGGIFVIGSDERLVEMTAASYDSEQVLQELLEKYPSLIAGDQVDPETPRRWLLVSREVGLASERDGGNRWALDHLFLDQDAVPTLVEVKRITDTRIRREVIGQMLDYAANAVVYLPVETIRSRFEESHRSRSSDPDTVLREFLEPGATPEHFWQSVKTNLQAGRVRLLFVADEIPPELRRVVEFLNQQMDPAEVLAVEIRQYASGEFKTFVPRVFGQTEEAQTKKSGSALQSSRTWDEASFFDTLEQRVGPGASAVAQRVLEWTKAAEALGKGHVYWGSGKRDGSFIVTLRNGAEEHYPVAVYTYGRLEIQFQYLRNKPPFDKAETRHELLSRLNRVPGVQRPPHTLTNRR